MTKRRTKQIMIKTKEEPFIFLRLFLFQLFYEWSDPAPSDFFIIKRDLFTNCMQIICVENDRQTDLRS